MATKTKSANLGPVRGMTRSQEEKFIRDCYDNFPEASQSLVCTGWKYKKFLFVFLDPEEEGKEHVIRLADAIRGFRLFVQAVDSGKLPGLGLPADYLNLEDGPGIMDASCFDAMVQMAIFGEVIYG